MNSFKHNLKCKLFAIAYADNSYYSVTSYASNSSIIWLELIGVLQIGCVFVFVLFQEEYAQMAALLEKDLKAGFVKPVIAAEFPLKSAAEAHHDVIEHKKGSCGKIILTV